MMMVKNWKGESMKHSQFEAERFACWSCWSPCEDSRARIDLSINTIEWTKPLTNLQIQRERERLRWRHSLSRLMISSTTSTLAKRRRWDSRMRSGLPPFSTLNKLMSNILSLCERASAATEMESKAKQWGSPLDKPYNEKK